MNRIHTTTLTPVQCEDIKQLADACKCTEPLTLTAPCEDGLEYFLYYDHGHLRSMLFLFFPHETVCECCAFTHPAFRRKGYFTALLEEALNFMETYENSHGFQADFCFLSDRRSPDAAAVLQTLGATYWYEEYGMERTLPAFLGSFQSDLIIEDAKDGLYTASLNGCIIGVCMVIPNGESVYFYGFEIKEAYRRKGHGLAFLFGMLSLLAADYRRITLQVSDQNTAALSLYKKTGFTITETLSYYLY